MGDMRDFSKKTFLYRKTKYIAFLMLFCITSASNISIELLAYLGDYIGVPSHREDGEYFLSNHGVYYKVSAEIYWLTSIQLIVGFLGVFLLVFSLFALYFSIMESKEEL